MDTLSEHEPKLYDKLKSNNLLIEDNVLKCYDYDEITKRVVKKIIVPFYIRGKLMNYAHHNITHHHHSHKYTYRKLTRKFWWSSMKKDVEIHCKQCVSCQFVKDGPRKRAPLIGRERPLPREHLFADILDQFINDIMF